MSMSTIDYLHQSRKHRTSASDFFSLDYLQQDAELQ